MNIEAKRIKLKNGREVELRSPRPSEAQKFLDHLVITHEESYKNLDRLPESWKKMSVEDEKKIIEVFEASESRFFIVAIFEDKIVGGMGIVGDEREFRRHSSSLGMSIQNAFAGVGLGTEMMKHAFATAKGIDISRIELTVRTYNKPAIALYEKVGFERVGVLKKNAFVDGEFVDEYSYQVNF